MFNRQTRFLLIWIVTNTLAWAVSFLVAYLLGIILYDYLVTTIPSDEPKVSYSFFVSHSHSGLFAFLEKNPQRDRTWKTAACAQAYPRTGELAAKSRLARTGAIAANTLVRRHGRDLAAR